MLRTVTTSFSAEEFALLRRQFRQRRDVLVIRLVDFFPAVAALGLFMQTGLFLSLRGFRLASLESCHFVRILLSVSFLRRLLSGS